MSLFPIFFCTRAVSSLHGEYAVHFPLPDGVFLPCDHGLGFLHQLIYVRTPPIKKNTYVSLGKEHLKRVDMRERRPYILRLRSSTTACNTCPLFPSIFVPLLLPFYLCMKCVCVCVCVSFFFPFILDIKFVGRTGRGHTGGRSHRRKVAQDLSSTFFIACFPLPDGVFVPCDHGLDF